MKPLFCGFSDTLNASNNGYAIAVAIVPPMVQKNRKALTANDLFSGEIVLISMVMAGAIQFSALKYSRASMLMANAKPPVEFIWIKVVRAKKTLPNMPLKMQMYALVIKIPFYSP